MKIIFALIFCLIATFAIGRSSVADAILSEKSEDDGIGVVTNLNNKLLLKLVNEKRASGCNCGNVYMPPVPRLKWNDTIALAASNHSKDMNRKNFFDHDSSNGKKLKDRFDAVGYKWRAIAENIAMGQRDERDTFNSWLKSQGHCLNFMNGIYKEMGAAREGKYWTQDFGTKRNW